MDRKPAYDELESKVREEDFLVVVRFGLIPEQIGPDPTKSLLMGLLWRDDV
jgi:ATP-dependent protease Clp ATPase subunit